MEILIKLFSKNLEADIDLFYYKTEFIYNFLYDFEVIIIRSIFQN